jgi:Ca-activated chloride channel family protein
MRNILLVTVLAAVVLPLSCGGPSATLEAPDQANAGSVLSVAWTGPGLEGDRVALRKPGVEEVLAEAETAPGAPATLTLPLEAGEYEIVYLDSHGKVLATRRLTVNPNEYTLQFPGEIQAGQWFDVAWTGPDNVGDYITIVPEGAAEGEWDSYAYTCNGSPAVLQAPLEAGTYEIRYSTEQVYPNPTLYSAPVTVIFSEYAVMAPEEIMAGAAFDVQWYGPDNPGDYVTIVPAGSPEGAWDDYAYTVNGNPATLDAPAVTGAYEVRYSTEQVTPNPTLAATFINVVEADITLSAPETVAPGESFEVNWTGPDGDLDYITIVPAGAEEGAYTSYAYTSEGTPLFLEAPGEPGDYEIRYASDRVDGTFASIPIRVE